MTDRTSKIAEIENVVSTWLEPEGGLTSYQAMMEVLRVLDGLPKTAPTEAELEAERRRWEEDRPPEQERPRRPTVNRSKQVFLG